jgi:hypothetical protein
MQVIDRVLTIPPPMRCSAAGSSLKRGDLCGITAGATFAEPAVCAMRPRVRLLLYAAGHGRAISQYPVIRGHPGRHDRGGAGNMRRRPPRASKREPTRAAPDPGRRPIILAFLLSSAPRPSDPAPSANRRGPT